ncbi:MAG: hypothetical protein DMF81_08465 [Acidobacteria bacterium]|nr:MAG: hypothetical protein DMF81_08465 [Acidobacteriota bacterium]
MQSGRNGSSWISHPATIGAEGSRSVVRLRRSRLFACPRRPSRIMLCRDSTAFTTRGSTDSS